MVQATERRQVLAYDRIIKTRAWSSLLLVHPRGDLEVNGLLAFCPRLQITLVWDPEFLPSRAAPTERARRTAVLARLWVTSRANPRLRICTGPPLEITSELLQEGASFSGAILAQLDDGKPLHPQLKAWAALVAPGGLLIGKQHVDLRIRSELIRAVPKFRPWPNGLWLAEVDGLHLNGSVKVSPEVPGERDWTVDEPPASPIAGVELPAISAGATGSSASPLDLIYPADVSRETGAFENNAGPIRPPVLNLKRTRPVWDTLEANLGL